MSFASLCRAQILYDNFASDSRLNSSLWATQSSILSALAPASSSPGSTLLTPTLGFSSAGMQMSGVNGDFQFSGISSLAAFTPPFTLNTTVMGTLSYGNAFAVFLVNSNLSQWLDINGDLIPNTCYQNIWINHTGSGIPLSSLGTALYGNPSLGVFYTIQISVGTNGNASVVLMTNGVPLATQSGLSVGNGPFYVVLAQREGWPCVSGPLAATWQSINVTPSEALTITAGQGGSVSYQTGRESGIVSEGESIILQLAYGEEVSLTANPCSKDSFTSWSPSSGITGPDGEPVATTSSSTTITITATSQIAANFFPSDQISRGLNTWSGYVIGMPGASEAGLQPDAVSDVKGTWIVPTVQNCTGSSQQERSSAWIGIGGLNASATVLNQPLVQIGTAQICTNGNPQYYAWYEVVSISPVQSQDEIQIKNFPVSPGDMISAEIIYIKNQNGPHGVYCLAISNDKRNVSRLFTVEAPLDEQMTAEWIVEDPQQGLRGLFKPWPLANFGTTCFSNCSVTLNFVEEPINGVGAIIYAATMVNDTGEVKARPSALSCDGSSFSVIWQHQ